MKKLGSSSNGHQIGGLIWWTFRETASPPEKLAKCALELKVPTIFLPVPFPIDPSVAFGRALQRTTANVPVSIGGLWRADRMTGFPDVDGPVRKWLKELGKIERLELGILQSWTPRRVEQPWVVRIWIALDPSARALYMFPVPGAPRSGVKEMMARVKRMFEKELRNATAPEIGDGVAKALEHVGGVKLRAGLWSVPGEHGIKLAKSVKRYLSNVGKSHAGMLIFRKSTRSLESGAGNLVEMGLLEEVDNLATEIQKTNLKTIGTGALRTLWDRVEIMREKLQTNEELIGGAINKLLAKLEPPRSLLRKAASDKKMTLNRTAGPTAFRYLHDGISALRNAARKRDLEGLMQAERLLVSGQAAARTAGISLLVARLRKLTRAAIQIRKKVFFEALERAATYVDKQARNSVPYSKSV